MTYAHSYQSFPLPHLFNGAVMRHFDPFFADECGICPFDGPPAIACDLHGYVYSREQSDRGYYVQSYPLSFAEQWRQAQEYTDYGDYDFYDYFDDFDRVDDSYEEMDSLSSELAAYYGEDLRDDAPAFIEPVWREEQDRYYDAKYKRARREAINRSASYRRRDLSVHARGRSGDDSRRYAPGVTPRRDYVAKKEAAI